MTGIVVYQVWKIEPHMKKPERVKGACFYTAKEAEDLAKVIRTGVAMAWVESETEMA